MNKHRILIVDDELPSARLLKANLEQTGRYEAQVENWPEDVLKRAREFKPDLVLLDVLMPRMPGGNVAEALRSDPELGAVPIIFLTAAVKKSLVKEHEGVIGGAPFIAKPATVEEIIEGIEQQLGKTQPQT